MQQTVIFLGKYEGIGKASGKPFKKIYYASSLPESSNGYQGRESFVSDEIFEAFRSKKLLSEVVLDTFYVPSQDGKQGQNIIMRVID